LSTCSSVMYSASAPIVTGIAWPGKFCCSWGKILHLVSPPTTNHGL
jgi:hypothetical protein